MGGDICFVHAWGERERRSRRLGRRRERWRRCSGARGRSRRVHVFVP